MVFMFLSRWSELTRKIELWVEIQELNEQGEYSPVEVITKPDILTGGIYQLRQGQQRRIQVRVKPVQNSGTLPIICQSIVSIAIGSVSVRWVGTVLWASGVVSVQLLKSVCHTVQLLNVFLEAAWSSENLVPVYWTRAFIVSHNYNLSLPTATGYVKCCPPPIPQGLVWDWTCATTVRGHWITVWAVAQP